ncbi:polysaccharide deacetylase family protein [Microtetraspora malaysiensis]|uniref:polysaccharide deacetylase family protein n=1 Tax=Microtetraspora malaysiensis TaxID=161358 RepID=UPI00082DAC49|nr:polysaccharide deacetylase family protein [Microtetraspora malaysiensis]
MGRFGVVRIGVACAGLVALAACQSNETNTPAKAKPNAKAAAISAELTRKANMIAAAKVRANELGKIPVIMYHRITDKPGGTDDRTPAQFRAELERLASENYVPITAAEYVTGKIDIPAGTHPVVLTFDDSSPSQLTLDEMGTPKPDTAVGILLDVSKKHPGFRPVGTFYVIRDMFGKFTPEERTQVLSWLRDNGFDIGNHTRDHLNLLGKSEKEVTEQIAAGQKLISDLDKKVQVHTLALPYGNQPRNKQWALHGSANGVRYDYQGVFLAGYTPAPSPFTKEFDPVGLPRIRSMDKKGDCVKFCSTAWLDELKANPDERYTSDGNPATVAFPKFKAPFVAKSVTTNALPY